MRTAVAVCAPPRRPAVAAKSPAARKSCWKDRAPIQRLRISRPSRGTGLRHPRSHQKPSTRRNSTPRLNRLACPALRRQRPCASIPKASDMVRRRMSWRLPSLPWWLRPRATRTSYRPITCRRRKAWCIARPAMRAHTKTCLGTVSSIWKRNSKTHRFPRARRKNSGHASRHSPSISRTAIPPSKKLGYPPPMQRLFAACSPAMSSRLRRKTDRPSREKSEGGIIGL